MCTKSRHVSLLRENTSRALISHEKPIQLEVIYLHSHKAKSKIQHNYSLMQFAHIIKETCIWHVMFKGLSQGMMGVCFLVA